MRIAIIENDIVVNVIVSEEIPDNGVECDDLVYAGWSYVDSIFIPPVLEIVEEIIER